MKYKVGDKVEISWSGDSTIVGEVGTIYACNEINGYLVKLDNENIEYRERGYFLTEYLELIPQTNRQWLESLSDEGLAEFLTSDNWVCKDIDADLCWFSGSNISCRQCKKQWLQAEHKE